MKSNLGGASSHSRHLTSKNIGFPYHAKPLLREKSPRSIYFAPITMPVLHGPALINQT